MAAGTCYRAYWSILWPFNILYVSAQKHVDYVSVRAYHYYIDNKHGEIPVQRMTKVLMRDGKIGWIAFIPEPETETDTRYRIFIEGTEERYRTPKGKQRPFDIIEIDEA